MCPITVQREVIEFCPMTFFIPNAFTPNGDGLNDTFEPKMSNIETYKIMIFNRWGELIFEGNDPRFIWDGTYKGVVVPDGTYTYKIDLTTNSGREKQLIGHVNSLR